MQAFRRGALAAIAVAGLSLSAQLASAVAPDVGTNFLTIKVREDTSSPYFALGSNQWGGTRSLSPTVYYDNGSSTYHMWFRTQGEATPEVSEASSLFLGDLTNYRHATSTDGINYTASPGFMSWSADPNYAANGATTTPSMVFPRISMTTQGLKMVTWTHAQGFPDPGVVFGEYNYNASVHEIDLANPTVATHLGPVSVPTSTMPGQINHSAGIAEIMGQDYLFGSKDVAGNDMWSGVYQDQESIPALTQPTTVGDTLDFDPGNRIFQISRVMPYLNEFYVGAFFEAYGGFPGTPTYDPGDPSDPIFANDRGMQIQYAESSDGGLTWTIVGDIFGGAGESVTIDGLDAADYAFNAPETALVNDGNQMLFYFTAMDNAGNLVVVGNIIDAPNIPEPASLALLAGGGLMLLRRKRA